MTRKPIWVDGRVDVLLAALHDLGMSVSRAAAAELIGERVQVGVLSDGHLPDRRPAVPHRRCAR